MAIFSLFAFPNFQVIKSSFLKKFIYWFDRERERERQTGRQTGRHQFDLLFHLRIHWLILACALTQPGQEFYSKSDIAPHSICVVWVTSLSPLQPLITPKSIANPIISSILQPTYFPVNASCHPHMPLTDLMNFPHQIALPPSLLYLSGHHGPLIFPSHEDWRQSLSLSNSHCLLSLGVSELCVWKGLNKSLKNVYIKD